MPAAIGLRPIPRRDVSAADRAENLIKAHKLHLASDRTSCSKATANQFRLLVHTAAYWLLHTLRGLAPKASFWRDAQFDTIRLALIKVAGRVTELVTRIKVALPSCYPDRDTLFTVALFQKDIKSYIQARTVLDVTLESLGYDPVALGDVPGALYDVTTPVNTPGGDLKGYEISLQKPFTFLPGFLANTGGIINYTHVESDIAYYTVPGSDTTTTASVSRNGLPLVLRCPQSAVTASERATVTGTDGVDLIARTDGVPA